MKQLAAANLLENPLAARLFTQKQVRVVRNKHPANKVSLPQKRDVNNSANLVNQSDGSAAAQQQEEVANEEEGDALEGQGAEEDFKEPL